MGINTVRLHICHHQIVGIGSGTFSSFFFRFGYEIYLFIELFCRNRHRYILFIYLFLRFGYAMLLFIEFFCCIGLFLILALIRFCFGFLGYLRKFFFSQFYAILSVAPFYSFSMKFRVYFCTSISNLNKIIGISKEFNVMLIFL